MLCTTNSETKKVELEEGKEYNRNEPGKCGIFCAGFSERTEREDSLMKIVVLAGGTSTERDVSLISGKKIYTALKENGHKVVLCDVFLGLPGQETEGLFEKEIDWIAGISDISEAAPDIEAVKAMREHPESGFFGPNVIELCRQADIVFMALHGENGENGKIQAAFDLWNIKYTGTDYYSSAIAMDKALTKEIFQQNGVPTPAGMSFRKGEEAKDTVPFPKVVKVTTGGSSVGVYIVKNETEYRTALDEAFMYGDEVVVEQYIKGREFSVGVMEGKALPIIEIAPLQGFYDYKNKYQAGSTVETCPAVLSEEKTKEMQAAAEKGFQHLRLKTYARLDFMMSEEDGSIYCLEANTLPGMTPTSLLPQEAAAIGIDFHALCDKIVEISLKKYV